MNNKKRNGRDGGRHKYYGKDKRRINQDLFNEIRMLYFKGLDPTDIAFECDTNLGTVRHVISKLEKKD